MLSAKERTLAMQKLLALNNKYGNRITASAGPLEEARNWLRVESAAKKGEEAFKGEDSCRLAEELYTTLQSVPTV